jgi:hypothetical protein
VHPWQIIAKFWPILIIFWGLSKLIDFVQAQMRPDAVAPPLFSGSEVVLLVLILVMGTAVSHVVLHPWKDWGWNINDDELSNIFLNSYTYTQTFSQPVSGAPHVLLEDQRGDVEVEGGDHAAIDVVAKETIRADDENAAKKISNDLQLALAEEAGHYILHTNRRSLADDGRRVTVDLSLRAPLATTCDISAERGDIRVSGLNGDQNLATRKGDIRANGIQGLVKVHKSGGQAEVRGVKGSVEIDGRGDDVEVADVTDTVTVHGEFGGSLQFRNIGQTLRFDSLRTDMTAQKLTGHLSMEVGSLDLNGIDGPFEITTRQKDINVSNFKHSVHITDSNSQITLETSTPPTHDIQVQSKNGAIELTLPPSSNFQIEAASRHGEVECEFSGPGLKLTKDHNAGSISGSYGKGGPMIRLNTEYGGIRILRTGSPSTPPAAPHHDSGDDQTTWNRPPRQARPAAHAKGAA